MKKYFFDQVNIAASYTIYAVSTNVDTQLGDGNFLKQRGRGFANYFLVVFASKSS